MELNHDLFHYERNALPFMLQSFILKKIKIRYNTKKEIELIRTRKNILIG